MKRLFSRRWFIATLLVLAGAALCIRLGIWQLDRLEQRRAFNARVSAAMEQAALDLNEDLPPGPLPEGKGSELRSGTLLEGSDLTLQEAGELYNMEYRQVVVSGVYDHAQEIAIQNQSWGNEWGVRLLTPLVISGSDQAVLVDRGWIPAEAYNSGDWSAFAEPGIVTVQGILRRPQAKAEIGSRTDPTPAPGEALRKAWYFANIEQISKQVTHPLLPVYVQQAPSDAHSGLPFRSLPEIEISEGPHMGYALQWFSFAVLLLVGYPLFVRRQEQRTAQAAESAALAPHLPHTCACTGSMICKDNKGRP